MAGEFVDELAQLWEEEGLFARNMDGQLIRVEKATEDDYLQVIDVTVDERKVTVAKALPLMDSQGNIVRDANGRTIPRLSTIFDAAQKAYVLKAGDQNPIPTLCHQEHMRPIGVCRVCSVVTGRMGKDGKVRPDRKLVPACFQPVQPDMVVYTLESPDTSIRDRLRSSIKMLTELLAADHLDTATTTGHKQANELGELAARLECDVNKFKFDAPAPRVQDFSSPLIAVNRNACILCQRCVRACDDIKKNNVIGRTGKGYSTQISFDLNVEMEDSSCVSCGECMASCPTDALTFRTPVQSDWHSQLVQSPGYSPVDVEELREHRLFRSVATKWLQWNQDSVVKRRVKKGDVLCWLGEYGSTAYILNRGQFGLWFRDSGSTDHKRSSEGIFSKWTRALRGRARSTPNPSTLPRSLPESQPDEINTPDDLMLGEMSCLSHHPRTSTIIAISDGEIYEIRRNVLHMLQRNSAARRELDQVYRRRAIFSHLRNVSLFESLNELQRQQCADFLRDKVDLIRVDPGQAIFRQGEIAEDFYMIRIGYVKVSQTFMGTEHVRTYLRPNQFFGDIGLFNQSEDLRRLEPESGQSGRRTSTCSALDDVELVRIKGDHFRQMLLEFSALKDVFVKRAESMLTTDVKHREVVAPPLKEFLDQGLFNAQKLLVLDLDSCTRCDECVKACADTHGGVTRLVREGLRFDKYLVASACRSCSDPYCLVGCPVDAIHRDGSLEITIESHCIGCGLCARNCPYGNINMAPGPEREITIGGSATPMAFVQQQATTCDLCKSVGVDASNSLDEVSCVYACPHNAAFRMDGSQLLSLVQDRSTTPID